MGARTKVLSTDRTIYPLDYDKNAQAGLTEWREYIHTELQNSILPTEGMVVQANKILAQEARYKAPLTKKQMANGDIVVYCILITLAVGFGLLITLKF